MTFTGAVYLAQSILFVAGVMQKGLLGPIATGYWALLHSFLGFFTAATLGASDGTTRQIPLRRGRGDFAGAAAVANTGNSFSLAAVGVAGPILAAIALAFGGGWTPEIRYGLVLLGLVAPLQCLSDCHESLFQTTKLFRAVSMGRVLKALIVLTVQTVFVLLFGFYGMFAGLAAGAVGMLLLWRRMGLTGWRRPAFSWGIDRARLRELIAYGAPITLWGQAWVVFMGTGTFIVAAFAKPTELGYYALGVSVTSYLLFLPKSIGGVLSPRMAERFGSTQQAESLRHYAVDVQRLLAFMVVPISVAAAYFLFPVLVRQALPAFRPAVPVVEIMAVGTFFLALFSMPVKVMITVGYRLVLIVLMVLCVALSGSATYIALVVLDTGIPGVAVATGFGYFAAFAVTTGYGLTKLVGVRQMLGHTLELLGAFAYLVVALLTVDWLFLDAGTTTLTMDVVMGVLKLATATVLLTPLLLIVEKRQRGVTMLWSLASSGLRAYRQKKGREAPG